MSNKVIFKIAALLFYSTRILAATPAESELLLPKSWVQLPEDHGQSAVQSQSLSLGSEDEPSQALSDLTLRIFDSSVRSASKVESKAFDAEMSAVSLTNSTPKDWTPWHMEYFTTDLAVSAKGLIGVLGVKGSPAIQVFWRKQGKHPSPVAAPQGMAKDSRTALANVTFGESPAATDVDTQIEPAMKAALASGKVQNADELRKNLRNSAQQFLALVGAAETAQRSTNSQWWVSGLRLDLLFEASGKVHWAQQMGGEMRLRFEWKRIKRNDNIKPLMKPQLAALDGQNSSFLKLVSSLESALEEASAEVEAKNIGNQGLKPYTFRIGFGLSGATNIGVVKTLSSGMGQINFSRDVKKPTVFPAETQVMETSPSSPILMIEDQPKTAHVEFAQRRNSLVRLTTTSAGSSEKADQALYRIDATAFKMGLAKAMKMAKFFSNSSLKVSDQTWKPFEIKTGFDLSFTGDMGLVAISELVSAEIGIFNMNF